LENKTDTVVLETFEKLYNKIMEKQKPLKVLKEKTKIYAIHQIISDNEGSFQSNIFSHFLVDKNIILTMNASNDHHVLGIIDNFALRLKTILKKTFLFNKSTRWVDILDNIIKIYNNTPHSALNGLTPK
jgi:transposase InsO family protein